ncbi:hypothetical protein CDFC105_43995 [Clostridioides difficile]|nr:hypothetical protein CDFC105_43995 [Clostridioides difficile]
MIRPPPRSTRKESSAASDVYKRQLTEADIIGVLEELLIVGADVQHDRKALFGMDAGTGPVSYTHLRAHETGRNLVCRLLLEKKKKTNDANLIEVT